MMVTIMNKIIKYFDYVYKICGFVPASAKMAIVGVLLKAGVAKSVIISVLILL
jgi:hypothetical protein